MPGYSGTPLPKKLGIKDGKCVHFVGLPSEVGKELKPALSKCVHVDSTGHPAGMLWVSWPKKSSGVTTDLDENIVRETGLSAGLVDVKVCAVTEIWSGLKFVRRLKDR